MLRVMSCSLVFASALLAALVFVDVEPALAHGGKIIPPPGRQPIPVMPPPVNIPNGGNPSPTTGRPNPRVTTPGGRARTGGGPLRPALPQALPTADWETWWGLNRWGFLPERLGVRLKSDKAVTPTPADGEAVDPAETMRLRRRIVGHNHILPFLLERLDPTKRERDEVVAAALIALGKIARDTPSTELILKYLHDPKAANVVRESAALAVGLLRRTHADEQLDPVQLDLLRRNLFVHYDEAEAPIRSRSWALLSLGLLADQPYFNDFTKDGKLVVRELWSRMEGPKRAPDLTAALLQSLSMQPRETVSSEMFDGLRAIVAGQRVLGRKWDPDDRSHALTTLARLEGPNWYQTLLQVTQRSRYPTPIRRAAFIALGTKAETLRTNDRIEVTNALLKGLDTASDALTKGLALISIGRVLNADLAIGSVAVLQKTKAKRTLVHASKKAIIPVRGFAVLAMALAGREVDTHADKDVATFIADTREQLLHGFLHGRGDDRLRGAHAIAMGLVRSRDAIDPLLETLGDKTASPELRGHSAVALAMVGAAQRRVREALRRAVLDRRSITLPSEAALALSYLGGPKETEFLIKEMQNARSVFVLAQVGRALGHMDDIQAVAPLMEVVRKDDTHGDEARALAVASLGLLGDTERRPSLLRLTQDANYPARTDALSEAYTIL